MELAVFMAGNQLLLKKKSNTPLIAIDLMGCGREPVAIAESVMATGSLFRYIFLAHESCKLPSSYAVHYAPDLFTEKDNPLEVARRKKTSLTAGIKLLAEGKVDALITAGDTGTLIASSRLYLNTLLPSRKVALMTKLPTLKGQVLIGDLGANIHVKAEDFLEFAKLSIALLQAEGIARPKMALLNIGQESTKGSPEWVKAYSLLQEFSSEKEVTFLGNIEACDLFTEDVQIVITEALAGNILLKTAEGVAKMVLKALKGSLNLPPWLDWSAYPGALLSGLEVPIIKVHGYSDEKAFLSALASLERLLEEKTMDKMAELLESLKST
ncbi:MAG: hypothetical protein WCN87_00360 [Chlamydiota bacterium]